MPGLTMRSRTVAVTVVTFCIMLTYDGGSSDSALRITSATDAFAMSPSSGASTVILANPPEMPQVRFRLKCRVTGRCRPSAQNEYFVHKADRLRAGAPLARGTPAYSARRHSAQNQYFVHKVPLHLRAVSR